MEVHRTRLAGCGRARRACCELAAENSATEYQQRIAELTQETERLVSEVKLGNEALESVRAQLQTQSDLQADLSERLGAIGEH